MKENIKYLLCLMLFSIGFASYAEANNIVVDTISIQIRNFDDELIVKYLENSSYNYEKNPRYEQNILKRWWYTFLNKLRQAIGRETLESTWNILKVIIILLGLGILGQFLLKSTKTKMFRSTDRSPDYHPNLIKSEGAKENLKILIDKYEVSNSFREAFRYRFLDILRSLDETKTIEWKDYKTNEDYIKEIDNQELSAIFKKLARKFEFIFYGEFDINLEDYSEAKKQFEALQFLINGIENAK